MKMLEDYSSADNPENHHRIYNQEQCQEGKISSKQIRN